MRTLYFELAGAPRGKERPRFTRATGRAFTSVKTIHYEGQLAYAAQVAMDGQPLFEGPLFLRIVAYMPIPVRKLRKWKLGAFIGLIRPEVKPDFDNIAKMVDAFNLVVWTDDKQVVEAQISKHYSESPRLEVTVREIPIAKEPSLFD